MPVAKGLSQYKSAKKFTYRNMYFFRYRAKGAEEKTLHVYDQAPIIVCLDIGPKHVLGVNMHWIPQQYRRDYLDTIISLSEKIGDGTRKRIVHRLYYETLKNHPLLKRFALNAIRRYIKGRIKNPLVIPPEKWNTILGNGSLRSRNAYRAKGYKHH